MLSFLGKFGKILTLTHDNPPYTHGVNDFLLLFLGKFGKILTHTHTHTHTQFDVTLVRAHSGMAKSSRQKIKK